MQKERERERESDHNKGTAVFVPSSADSCNSSSKRSSLLQNSVGRTRSKSHMRSDCSEETPASSTTAGTNPQPSPARITPVSSCALSTELGGETRLIWGESEGKKKKKKR